MSKPNLSLTKTCSSCGQQKPLSAFLQLAGAKGSMYGNICASCRKTVATQGHKETDEGTTRKADHRIGSEEKVHGDIKKKLDYQRVDELYREDRKVDAQKQSNQNKKVETTAKAERSYRESLWGKNNANTQAKPASAQPIFGSEQHKMEAGKTDVNTPVVSLDQEKFKTSSIFKQMVTSVLGNAAPIKKMMKQTGEHKQAQTSNQMPQNKMMNSLLSNTNKMMKQTTEHAKTQSQKNNKTREKDPLIVEIENNLRPKPKR